MTDDDRKDGEQAQAEPQTRIHAQNRQNEEQQQKSNPQHEHEENQHDESLRKPKPMVGWLLLGCVVVLASIVVLIAVGRAVENPRTDDAEVFANFIGMAPQVDGPIMQLPIRDNQYVKAGDLLFVVDERPYRYALERALSRAGRARRSNRRSSAFDQLADQRRPCGAGQHRQQHFQPRRPERDHLRSGGKLSRLARCFAPRRGGSQVRRGQSAPA